MGFEILYEKEPAAMQVKEAATTLFTSSLLKSVGGAG